MTFASTKTLVVMTILWAIALFGIDYAKNPKTADSMFSSKNMGVSAADGKPIVKLWMNHMCCTGCLSDVTKALEKIPNIKVRPKDLESQEAADMESADKPKDYGNEVVLDITDLKTVDFMAIDHALRDAGLTADRMELSGPRHFRLNAEVKHMCCGLCATGVREGLEITRGLKSQGHFKWLDSFVVDKQKKLVTAHARYDASADVNELILALNHVGFQPSSVFAVVDSEGGAQPNSAP
jgi:copper chaperone CopZ